MPAFEQYSSSSLWRRFAWLRLSRADAARRRARDSGVNRKVIATVLRDLLLWDLCVDILVLHLYCRTDRPDEMCVGSQQSRAVASAVLAAGTRFLQLRGCRLCAIQVRLLGILSVGPNRRHVAATQGMSLRHHANAISPLARECPPRWWGSGIHRQRTLQEPSYRTWTVQMLRPKDPLSRDRFSAAPRGDGRQSIHLRR